MSNHNIKITAKGRMRITLTAAEARAVAVLLGHTIGGTLNPLFYDISDVLDAHGIAYGGEPLGYYGEGIPGIAETSLLPEADVRFGTTL